MNLVAHLARKDLRRILIPGALYAFFLAAKLVLGAVALGDIDAAQFATIRDYLKLATFAEWVISYVLVAAIIQEDPVVGANAFWMTRPISGLRLLTTKLLVLFGLLILLPVLIAFPWWHVCQMDVHSMALAAAQIALLQGLLVGFGLPLAVLTPNLGRYLACTLVAAAAWIAVMTSVRGRFVSRDSRAKFFKSSPGDNAFPVSHISHFIHLEANAGILPHDLNFHAFFAVAIDVAAIICVADRQNVHNIIVIASDASDELLVKHLLNLFFC